VLIMRRHETSEALAVDMLDRLVTRRQALFYSAALATGVTATAVSRAEGQKTLRFGMAVWDIAFRPMDFG
jgi:hypothetical protein